MAEGEGDDSRIIEYDVKEQGRFRDTLAKIITHPEVAEDIMRGIRFALRYFPEQGRDTGHAAPLPVYAINIDATENTPPLTVYYAFLRKEKRVLLISVRVSQS